MHMVLLDQSAANLDNQLPRDCCIGWLENASIGAARIEEDKPLYFEENSPLPRMDGLAW